MVSREERVWPCWQRPGAWGLENSCPWCSVLSRLIAHLVVAVDSSMRTTSYLNLIQSFPQQRRQGGLFQRSPCLVIHNSDLFSPTVILVRAMEFFESNGSELVPQAQHHWGIDINGSSLFHLDLRSQKFYRPPIGLICKPTSEKLHQRAKGHGGSPDTEYNNSDSSQHWRCLRYSHNQPTVVQTWFGNWSELGMVVDAFHRLAY